MKDALCDIDAHYVQIVFHGTRSYGLSLSRLNHWLPGCETYPEVMQGTAEFHHEIADTLLPQAAAVFE
jgi:hypothetical protein